MKELKEKKNRTKLCCWKANEIILFFYFALEKNKKKKLALENKQLFRKLIFFRTICKLLIVLYHSSFYIYISHFNQKQIAKYLVLKY